MPAVERIWTSAPPAGRWTVVIAASLLVHGLLLAVLGSASGVIPRQPPPPIDVDVFPSEGAPWPDFVRRAAAPAAEPRVPRSEPPRTLPDRFPVLRPADPEAVPEAGAQGVDPVWRADPGGLAARLANIPPGLIPGTPASAGVPLSWRRRCNLPLEGPISAADRRACEQSFLAEAEPPPSMRRIRPHGDPRDQFAAQGARNLAEYEARRRPLAGGTGVVGSGECPGGNLGMGCAGAHLPGDMRQGAQTTVRQDSNKLD